MTVENVSKKYPNYFLPSLLVSLSLGALMISITALLYRKQYEPIFDSILLITNILGFCGTICALLGLNQIIKRIQYKERFNEERFSEEIEMMKRRLAVYEHNNVNRQPKKYEYVQKISLNLEKAKALIITQYSDLMNNEKVKDEKVKERLLNSPEMLSCISDLRVSLYSLNQIERIFDYEENDIRFKKVSDSLRDFSNANISELMDNIDYLTALIMHLDYIGDQ